MNENVTQKQNPWFGILPLYITASVMMLTLMISNPVMPYITSDFGLTASATVWNTTLYTISAAILAPLIGWLSDAKGLKFGIVVSLTLYTLATFFSGFAPNFTVFLICRFFQGFGTAALIPGIMAYVNMYFPKAKRVSALAIMTACTNIGNGIGPLVSGSLTAIFSWRQLFLGAGVIMAVVLIIDIVVVKLPAPSGDAKKPLDFAGMIALIVGISCFVTCLSMTSTYPWGSMVNIALLAVSVIFLIFFYIYEKKKTAPLMDVSLLSNKGFMLPTILRIGQIAIQTFVATAMSYFIIMGLGYSATVTGAWATTYFLLVFPFSFLVGKINKKVKAKFMIIFGILTWAVGIFILSIATPELPVALLFVAAAIMALGNAIIPPVTTATSLSYTPAEKSGSASGTIMLLSNLASPIVSAIVIPYLSTIGAVDGMPNYALSIPFMSRIMLIFCVVILVIALIYPANKQTETAQNK